MTSLPRLVAGPTGELQRCSLITNLVVELQRRDGGVIGGRSITRKPWASASALLTPWSRSAVATGTVTRDARSARSAVLSTLRRLADMAVRPPLLSADDKLRLEQVFGRVFLHGIASACPQEQERCPANLCVRLDLPGPAIVGSPGPRRASAAARGQRRRAEPRHRRAGPRLVQPAEDLGLAEADLARVLPAPSALAGLLPWPGGIRRGATVARRQFDLADHRAARVRSIGRARGSVIGMREVARVNLVRSHSDANFPGGGDGDSSQQDVAAALRSPHSTSTATTPWPWPRSTPGSGPSTTPTRHHTHDPTSCSWRPAAKTSLPAHPGVRSP